MMIASSLGCWSIELVLFSLGLLPSFISNNTSFLFLDLDVGALSLSICSWAFGPASFLVRSYDCFCQLAGLGCWSIGLVLLKLGLQPSFISNNNHSCFWTWLWEDWTCPFEAGPSAQLHAYNEIILSNCFWTWMLEHWTCPFEDGPLAQIQFS